MSESNLDDDDMEDWLSVTAIEAELKPKVIETLDTVAGTYKRLRRLQDQDIQLQLKRLSLSPAQERKYKKLKNEIIGEVRSLRLNQARIDALVEQLFDINKRLVGHEGRLMRLAESHGVAREDFLKSYLGSELDPLWLNRVSKLPAKGWKSFVAKDKDKIKQHRHEIHALAGEAGLEIGEFRKVVHMVQKGEREARQAKKEMVEGNLRLVISIAKKHINRGVQFLDLIQEGNIGLMKAVTTSSTPRIQICDLRHLVDPAGGQPLAHRPVAYHPCARAYDRSHQPDRARKPANAHRNWPRADAGGLVPRSSVCRSRRCAGF